MKYSLSKIAVFLLVVISLESCNSESEVNPYAIGKHHIGLLTDSTQVRELDNIYSNDSISRYKEDNGFTGVISNINIFSKEGSALLVLSPQVAMDSTTTINTVKIEDSRYVTDKGISTLSTFGDIQAAYKVNKVNNLINTIVVSVDEINASFTIDKKELPANMRFDMDLNIDPIQIPEKAKIKYFMLHW